MNTGTFDDKSGRAAAPLGVSYADRSIKGKIRGESKG